MGKPYSMDLRERVVTAVEKGGLSRRRAAAQFGVAISTVNTWYLHRTPQLALLATARGFPASTALIKLG